MEQQGITRYFALSASLSIYKIYKVAMIQQKLKLSTDLKVSLQHCDEIWVVVAMISDAGFAFIQENVGKSAKQNYIVGVGLPTSPKVLTQLMILGQGDNFRSRIHHKTEELFHPKVYLLKSKATLTAFVGSANCTEGGLSKNLEFSIKTDEAEFCEGVIKWFNALYKFGHPITEDFLQSYASLYENRKRRIAQDNSEMHLIFSETGNSKNDLSAIDFSNQFFKREHYEAFQGNKPLSYSDKANIERLNVRNRFYKLHDLLYPLIKKRKWDLHEHYVFDDTVSSATHNAYTSESLTGMWLHYGRSKKQIKIYGDRETPLDFMRLQVIIHKDNLGVWNRIGKGMGSRVDRDYFKNMITTSSEYADKFYSLISKLPTGYFIQVNDVRKNINEFSSQEELTSFVSQDDFKFYFIIGIEFAPGDSRLSNDNIAETVMDNFSLLYLIYELMRHKMKL